MAQTHSERAWLMTHFKSGEWMPNPYEGNRKWDTHIATMIQEGLLEKEDQGDFYRLTEKGREAAERHDPI